VASLPPPFPSKEETSAARIGAACVIREAARDEMIRSSVSEITAERIRQTVVIQPIEGTQ
jgi:hypothetical protein